MATATATSNCDTSITVQKTALSVPSIGSGDSISSTTKQSTSEMPVNRKPRNRFLNKTPEKIRAETYRETVTELLATMLCIFWGLNSSTLKQKSLIVSPLSVIQLQSLWNRFQYDNIWYYSTLSRTQYTAFAEEAWE